MRLMSALLFVVACTSGASAQDKAPVDGTPAPMSVSAPSQMPAPPPVAVATGGGAATGAASSPRTRVTWEQRFAQANVTHDGHLTLEQAKAGYTTIARHFADIDVAKKGFVTEDDIRAWHKAKRASRHAQTADGSSMQPQQAFQRFFPSTMHVNTATDRIVPRMERMPDPAAASRTSLPESSSGSDAPL